jgi:3-dehydroquinate synthetase
VDAQAQVRFTVAFVPGLLDPGSTAVARACGSATAALVVSGADPGPVDDALWANLAAQRQPGPLQRVPRMCLPAGASGFDAANAVIRGALESGLARRDAFVTCGEDRIAQAVTLAAAMFRRHSTAVQVITNLAGLARVLMQGWQASLDHEPVSLPVLAVTAMVDPGRVAHDGPLTHAEAGAVRALVARLPASSGLADLLGNATSLSDATRLRQRLLEVLADTWPALLPSPPAITAAPPGGAGGPTGPAPTEHRTRRLSFSVTAETNVLDPQRSSLAGYLPTGARVLAFVDGYREAPVAALDSLLAAYRQAGRIRDFAVHVLAPAPALKSLSTARRVVAHAERMGLGPDDRIVVAGGGTVMDAVGFGAALYRGMTPFIRIPTTLVGLVDGGVGFKVGVDAEGRKNLIGAYHPPAACLCDPQFLQTLPSRELRCGLAEMIKIAAIADRELFELIEDYHGDVLARQPGPSVLRLIRQSIVAMVTDLAVNPCEAQLRRLPDFGHEFGHVLEVTSGMRLRHGEAVAIGMALSCQLASAAGYLSAPDRDRILGLIQRVGLPVHDSACDPAVLRDWLHADVVPHKGGSLHLAVPTAIGAGGFIESVSAIELPMLADACESLRDRGMAWLAAQGAS